MANSLKILSYLDLDIRKHLVIGLHRAASEHHIHKYDDTHLVAGIEEISVGVVPTAPNADSVEVCVLASLKKKSCALLGNS